MSHCVHGAGNNVAAISCCACISADALKFCTLQQHTWYDGQQNGYTSVWPMSQYGKRVNVVNLRMSIANRG